ncbi:NAD(P)H-dependent flavin oxidoreductase [Thiofilum flexile]|uniref:NAD(P)H-dependent flavin oxidoreductase n=1 Tax=Thiofilum flexile TaxID=125627 RepID=UPI00037FD5B6|nr:nitronate monooxygenase [Thiofilum flexile]
MHKVNIKNLLGTKFPIIQAPMAGVQDSTLTIAVSEAGGLGSLPCAMLSIEKIVSEIQEIKAATDKPYNLNFFCHKAAAYDAEKQLNWQKILKPYFKELGIEFDPLARGANRVPFNHDIADAIEPFKPALISFHFGLPDKTLIQRIKSWGTKIISSATTVEEAIWLESKGADGIIAQGLEAGGHRGMFLSNDISTQMGLFALLPQIIQRVNIPVIAAGGISDKQGVQAALLLGANAVQIGTAYLLCLEAQTSALHRAAISSAQSAHTALTTLFSGKPARGIVNRVMRELGYINPLAPDFPYAAIEMTQLRNHAEKLGVNDFSPLWCGQNTLDCQTISARELTLQLAGINEKI